MQVGRLLGVPVLVHPLFVVLLLLCAPVGLFVQAVVLFSIVLWHETAHAVAARMYGLHVSEIELLPFGGVARLEELLQLDPSVELPVALAGPISNVVLLCLAWLLVPLDVAGQDLYRFFLQANGAMAVFNLVPALPLDGGRVLRSRLVQRLGFEGATAKCAFLGLVAAVLLAVLGGVGFCVYGYVNALVFVIMGLFLFLAARQERKMAFYVLLRYLTRRKQQIRLKRVMPAKEFVVTEETTIGEVLHQLTPSCYHILWVIDLDGSLKGSVTEIELINALLEKGIQCTLRELMN